MVINPFDNKNIGETDVDRKVNLEKMQKYLVDNYMQSLANEDIIVIKSKIRDYLYDNYSVTSDSEIEQYTSKILDKIFGYGLLQKYLSDESITDIRVVRFDSIYVKRNGNWEKREDDSFKDEAEFSEYIRYITLKNGKTINYDKPLIVFSDRKNNLRIEAGIEPVNINGSSLVIRIHRSEKNANLEQLRDEYKMFSDSEYEFLKTAIDERKNIVISGKGGSGKTTLLRAIIDKLPDEMAISTNEETAELNITGKNVIQREVLASRNSNFEIGLDTLTRHSLVSSNDAIIIGELKGKEASLFFDSISTGHLGYATVHSDCAENTIDRLVTLVKRDVQAQSYKEEFVQKLLSKSIHYVIYMKNFKISEIMKIGFSRNSVKYEYIFKEGGKVK